MSFRDQSSSLLRRTPPPAGCVALILLATAGCHEPGSNDQTTERPEAAPAPTEPSISTKQKEHLAAWYERTGERQRKESFGSLITRVARLQLGVQYGDSKQLNERERLKVELETFQCVSFVESTLAVARCVWSETPDQHCFLRELEASRYRNGEMSDYPSRLHYFSDWMADNAERGRLRPFSVELGGNAEIFEFSFMTQHSDRYAPLARGDLLAQVKQTEERLSSTPQIVVSQEATALAESQLESGDLVAIVSTRHPGLLVRHAGFIDKQRGGGAWLLHASSYHKRVLLTSSGIAEYLARRPDRRGIIVARPLPPSTRGRD